MGKKPTAIEVKTNRFKIILKSRNISIQKLADSIGYTRPGLSKAINSGKMDPKTLDDISVYLNISPDFFTGEEPLLKIKHNDNYSHLFGIAPDVSGYHVPTYDHYLLKKYLEYYTETPDKFYPEESLIRQAFELIGKNGFQRYDFAEKMYFDSDFIEKNYGFLVGETHAEMFDLLAAVFHNTEAYQTWKKDKEETGTEPEDRKQNENLVFNLMFDEIPEDQEPDE